MRYFLALLLLTGCTHKPATLVTMTIAPTLDRAGCDLDVHNIDYWLGDDGMIGFGLTCEQAFQDWRHSTSPAEMNQI